MKLATQTHITAERFGAKEAIRILAEAGYDALDWSFFELTGNKSIWLNQDPLTTAAELKSYAKERNVTIEQAHAPFSSSKGNKDYDDFIYRRILLSMEAAAAMGVKNIIVHPKQHLPYRNNRKATWDMNLEFYRGLIPYCKQWGIVVCAENMWQYNQKGGHIVDSFLSQPEEFASFIDAIDSPYLKACLDIGHSALVGVEPEEFITELGPDRLAALHVHDVDYHEDCHTLPYTEKLNWEAICKALGKIGYRGNFTFEADNFIAPMPKELIPEGVRFMAATGRYLAKQVERERARSEK